MILNADQNEYNSRPGGYVKLWRDIWENPRLRTPSYLAVFIWLITHVYHGMTKGSDGKWRLATEQESKKVQFRGDIIALRPGQVTCGSHQISADIGVPSNTVRRILGTMVRDGLIEHQTSNRCSLIELKNWERDQLGEQQIGQQPSSGQASDGQPPSTKEEREKPENEQDRQNTKEINTAPQRGNADINEVISLIETTFGLPALDGSKKENRFAAYRLIAKVRKLCGGDHAKAMENIRAAIAAAKADPFWGSGGKMTSVMALEKHMIAILHKAASTSPITRV